MNNFTDWTNVTQHQFRLIATSDLHANLFPFDYYRDEPSDKIGLIRTATLIRQAQAEVESTLFVDNGDLIQGGPLGEIVQDEALNPMVAALSALGCAAINLGNHDLDFGLDTTERMKRNDGPAILCANITQLREDGSTGATLGRSRIIFNVDIAPDLAPLRVGLVGVMPPRVMSWAAKQLDGKYRALPMIATVARESAALRDEGADLVIAMAHSGLELLPGTAPDDNMAAEIAALPGIDGVVAGHTHMTFPMPGNYGHEVDYKGGKVYGTPLVQPGVWGSHIGLIDFTLEHGPNGWEKTHSHAHLRGITDHRGQSVAPEDEELATRFAPYHTRSRGVMAKPLGETQIALYSYLTMLGVDPSLRLISEAHKHAVRPLLPDAMAERPLLAAVAPFRGGEPGAEELFVDVPAGPLRVRHVFDLYIYPNTLMALDVTGADIAEWLERSSSVFTTILPGERDRFALRIDKPIYNFDVIPDLDYDIDLAATPGRGGEIRRVQNIRHQGRPLSPEDRFVLITNNFRQGGGGDFAPAQRTPVILETRLSGRDAIANYISGHSPIHVSNAPLFGFTPIQDASLLFPCSSERVGKLATSILPSCEIVNHSEGWIGVRMRL
ncbi:5'-nucleotidase C-terminal domain-containing protein [Paracoccaceae bacterium GXU_MW_L88]